MRIRKILLVAVAGVAAVVAGLVNASPAAAAGSQYAKLEIRPSITAGYYQVLVSGRVNVDSPHPATVTMRLKGDDVFADDDLGVSATTSTITTVGGPGGEFYFSLQVWHGVLDEDPEGDDEIYALVLSSTGWSGMTQNVYGNY
jgi:hypothetical protein